MNMRMLIMDSRRLFCRNRSFSELRTSEFVYFSVTYSLNISDNSEAMNWIEVISCKVLNSASHFS